MSLAPLVVAAGSRRRHFDHRYFLAQHFASGTVFRSFDHAFVRDVESVIVFDYEQSDAN